MAAIKKYGYPDINKLFVKKNTRLTLRKLLSLAREIPDPEDVWKHFDKDGSDDLDLAEVKQGYKDVMAYFGHKVEDGWEADVERVFKDVDTSGNGRVCKKEIGAFLFDLVDSNDDGEIQLSEMEDAIKAIADFTGNELVDDW